MTADAELVATLNRWRADPVVFATEAFGVTLDAWQVEALHAYHAQPVTRVAMQASAGVGKTIVLAIACLHFLLTAGDGEHHPNIFVTAINGDNLKANLWKELAVWFGKCPLFGHAFDMTTDGIVAKQYRESWFLRPRTWSKDADAEAQGRALSGLHGQYVMAVVDESGDVAPAVGRTLEQALSTCTWGRLMQAGNPTSQTGMLYDAAHGTRSAWTTIRISGDPDDPHRSTRVSLDWATAQIARFGRDNPWVQAFVLGRFPTTGFANLLGPEDVDRAERRRPPAEEDLRFHQKRIGVDVGRFGDDPTVFFPRHGPVAYPPTELRNEDSTGVVLRLAAAKSKWGSHLELIDDTGGYGAGVVDQAHTLGLTPIAVGFNRKADDPRFFNKRAEMYWRLAEWIKTVGCLPVRDTLRKQLLAHTYSYQNGRFQIEDKDRIKAKLSGHSPDEADALALTFALPELPAGPIPVDAAPAHADSEWDPLADRTPPRDPPPAEPRLWQPAS